MTVVVDHACNVTMDTAAVEILMVQMVIAQTMQLMRSQQIL